MQTKAIPPNTRSGAEPLRKTRLDAESVHQRDDARVRADAGRDEFARRLERCGFQRTDHPVRLAQLRRGGSGPHIPEMEVSRGLNTRSPCSRTAARSRRSRNRTSCPACASRAP